MSSYLEVEYGACVNEASHDVFRLILDALFRAAYWKF